MEPPTTVSTHNNIYAISQLVQNISSTSRQQTEDSIKVPSIDPSTYDCIWCYPLALTLIFSALFLLTFLVGLIGNVFVVYTIVSDKKLIASSVNQMLLNLAIADLGNLIFNIPDVVMVLLDQGWLLSTVPCQLIRFLQEYFLYASVLLQMSIGVERFLAICTPMRMQRFSSRTTLIVLAADWLIAAVFGAPYFLYMGLIYPRYHAKRLFAVCTWEGIGMNFRTVFKHAEFVLLYAFPLVLLSILYTIMGRVLWGKTKTAMGESMVADKTQQMAILKLRRSVVKMLIICMLLFFLCYTPIQAKIWISFWPPQWVRLIINYLPFMSSAANPVVYIMCCRHFHLKFVQLCEHFCQCWRPTQYAYICVSTKSDAKKLARSPYVSFRKPDKRRSNSNYSRKYSSPTTNNNNNGDLSPLQRSSIV